MQHRAISDNGKIASFTYDPRLTSGQAFLGRKFVGLEMVIKIFVFAVNNRIVDCDRLNQHRVSIFHSRRRHHDEPWIVGIDGFHALAVKWAASFCPAAWQTDCDWDRHIRPPIMRSGVV